jgi:hypothetical protein
MLILTRHLIDATIHALTTITINVLLGRWQIQSSALMSSKLNSWKWEITVDLINSRPHIDDLTAALHARDDRQRRFMLVWLDIIRESAKLEAVLSPCLRWAHWKRPLRLMLAGVRRPDDSYRDIKVLFDQSK